jgi:hypothetical protein
MERALIAARDRHQSMISELIELASFRMGGIGAAKMERR